jgi:hypothetical protein
MPPLGAAPLKLTVQAAFPGAVTLAGAQVKPLGITATIKLMAALAVPPLNDAVNAAVWLLAIMPAAALKVALATPAATVTLAGTVNRPVLLASVTTAALAAALLNVTLHVVLWPLPSVFGEQVSDVS